MKKDLLKRIIFDFRNIIKNAEINKRDYVFDKNANLVVTGMRRAGKSTFLYSIARELIEDGNDENRIVFINFEDERLIDFTVSDFSDIVSVAMELTDEKVYYFFDEIQIIPGWEKFVRRLADAKERVYVTGSNAKMLSKDIETTLGGRFMSLNIMPYSFSEYLSALGVPHTENDLLLTKGEALITRHCNEFLLTGGLPENINYTLKRDYLSSVFQKILLGDIISKNEIRHEFALKIIIKKIAEAVCTDISFSRLHSIVSGTGAAISKDKIIEYVHFSIDAYLIFPVKNYYAKLVEKESNLKYYFTDTGICNLFVTDRAGAALENSVAVALKRKYGDEVYYLKSAKTNIDIDFWVPQTGEAVQVCYELNDMNLEREIKALEKLNSLCDVKVKPIIVTHCQEDEIIKGEMKIQVIPAHKFLL